MEFQDTVVCRTETKKLKLADWITYAKGFKLASDADGARIRISWEKDRAPFVSFYLRTPKLFAENAAGLETDVILPVRPDGAMIHAVNLLFMDRSGEIFQLKQNIAPPEKEWSLLRFDASGILRKGVIVHKGGDGKVDFPVRLLGFNFELKPGAAADGSILVREWERARPLTRWEPGAWTVYGEGYTLGKGKNESELVVSRTPGGPRLRIAPSPPGCRSSPATPQAGRRMSKSASAPKKPPSIRSASWSRMRREKPSS